VRNVIDSYMAGYAFAWMMGLWVLGFSVGKSVAWTRKLADVA
jgi:hypothetical protein